MESGERNRSKGAVEMLLLQETKLLSIDKRICGALLGDRNFEWKASPSINRAGGLLCTWRKGVFRLQECIVDRSFIGLCGFWGDEIRPCIIINIYSPCNMLGKCRMWTESLEWRANSTVTLWCLAGDFNVVRAVEERRCVAELSGQGNVEIGEFNQIQYGAARYTSYGEEIHLV